MALALLTACAGPSRTSDDYVLKALNTAEAVRSAVETARLGVDATARERAFLPYLSVLFGDVEEDAGSAQRTFESVQPPDRESDAVRAELGEILDAATAVLGAVRIEIRREDVDAVVARGPELAAVSADLDAFIAKYEG